MRRFLAGAATGLALLVAAPTAAAQDSGWTGSQETTEARTTAEEIRVTATFVHRPYNPRFHSFDHRTWVTSPSGLPSGCPAGGEREVPRADRDFGPGPVQDSTDTWAEASAPCNGRYSFRIIATIDRGILGGGVDTSPPLTGTIEVAAPAPDVTKVAAASKDGAGVISWTALSGAPADFLGYRVERATGDDTWEVVAKVGRGTTSVTDSTPVGGEGAAYRVRTRRNGADGEVLSKGRTATIPGDGTTPSTPPGTDGGTTVPGTDGGTTVPDPNGGTTAPGGGDGGGGQDAGRGAGPARPQPRGRTGVGTRAPRLGQPSQANFPPLLTPDDGGFQEEIDYGRPLAGEEEDGEDELSSLFYEDDTGRGMAVPVATGFVLAAWAFHLRFLAKAARPAAVVPVAGGRRPGEPDPFVDHDPFLEPYEPPVVYEAPAHYRPPSLSERYDPFAP